MTIASSPRGPARPAGVGGPATARGSVRSSARFGTRATYILRVRSVRKRWRPTCRGRPVHPDRPGDPRAAQTPPPAAQARPPTAQAPPPTPPPDRHPPARRVASLPTARLHSDRQPSMHMRLANVAPVRQEPRLAGYPGAWGRGTAAGTPNVSIVVAPVSSVACQPASASTRARQAGSSDSVRP